MVDNGGAALNINLAIVGGKNAGKSALTVRFLTKRFIGEYDSQADLSINRCVSIIGNDVNLQLKDTTGSDWIKGPSALIRWSTTMVIVYSISDRKSYDLAVLVFEKLKLCERIDSSCVLLLANKNDLEHLREVSYEEGKNLASKHRTQFCETSAALDSNGVCSAFRKLLFEAITLQMSKTKLLENSELMTVAKKPSFIRRDSPNHRSPRFLSKASTATDSKRSVVDSISSSQSSDVSLSDDELYDAKPTPLPTVTRRSSTVVNKKRKISLPTFMTRTAHSQKYLHFNKAR